MPPRATDAIVEENETARLAGLRSALSVLALFALLAVPLSWHIPAKQPAATERAPPAAEAAAAS